MKPYYEDKPCTRSDCESDRATTGECHCSVYGECAEVDPVVLTDAQIIHDFGQEIARLRLELANTKKLLTLQESINHLLEQHIASQDTVIRAARQLVHCPASGALVCHERLVNALQALDHASS